MREDTSNTLARVLLVVLPALIILANALIYFNREQPPAEPVEATVDIHPANPQPIPVPRPERENAPDGVCRWAEGCPE